MLRLLAKACCVSHFDASARFDHCEAAVSPFVPSILCQRRDADRFTSKAEQEVVQRADYDLVLFTFLQVAFHSLDERTFSRIPWKVRTDPTLPTLLVFRFRRIHCRGGAEGGTGHACLSSSAFLLVEVGALFLTYSGTALNGALCGVDLFLTASGTALAGGLSMLFRALFDLSHNNVPLALRF